ncbi:MAG: CDP-diacylglycerol--glycerol-3-phosphate 3-phosphatidyltransferase [Omnitrophica bacterium RIFCSPLOWO2_12_FULL_50_11]|nr:MAG: CDP-diacylglycerol--glycerol-3-phosphate 3-phosphatidyltransferase [Omnitrophica bacterium RIFCSPLOWO2_12_FULL_50_11]
MLVTPNRLTALRIILACICAILLFSWRSLFVEFITAGLFSVACFTDWLDGYLARTKSMITQTGKIVDPIADKLLILGVMSGFAYYELYPVEWVILIGVREFLVTAWRLIMLGKSEVLQAEWAGKIKVGFQVGSIYATFVYLLLDDSAVFDASFAAVLLSFQWIHYLGIFLAALVTVASGIIFFHRLNSPPPL